MKIRVIQPWYDTELHNIGDIMDIKDKQFNEMFMEKVEEVKKDATPKGKTRTANKH